MKIAQVVAAALFILCFPLLLLTTNLRFEVNSLRLYEYGFDKYDVVEVTGIEEDDLERSAKALVDYFNGSRESPQINVTKHGQEIDLYTPREIAHLRDVRALIRFFYALQWITLAYVAAYIIIGFILRKGVFWKQLARVIFFGSLWTLGMFIFFGIWAAIDFDNLFHTFHVLSFSNDLWQLDPYVDHLIMMFPEDFFLDAAVILIGVTLLQALILGAGAWFCLKRFWPASRYPSQE